ISLLSGNVVPSSKDGIYLSRHIGLRSGIPENVGALTVNRLCGSGFQALINAAHQIKLGESKLIVAGGTENMTQTPFAVRNVRFGTALGMKYETTVGCDPTIMGIGPAPAIRQVLAHTGLKIDDIDIFEVNEAFAPQALAVQRELGIPMDKLNMNGGAIALGHPLGASGARISVHLAHELKRRNAKYAIGSACIGGGQGVAVLFENVH
ncbi:hypothetical protein GCK32_009942, partial [Trichostrongylus colubriformis]